MDWLPAEATAPLAFGDLNSDGDLEALAADARYSAEDGFRGALWDAPGTAPFWTTVVLRGADSEFNGTGCVVRVLTETARHYRRDFHRIVGISSAHGGTSRRAAFVLDGAVRLLGVNVRWPRENRRQSFFQPPGNNAIFVNESETDLDVRLRHTFQLRQGPQEAARR